MPTTTPPLPDVPVIRCGSEEPRADSRDIAKRLGTKHSSTYELLNDHRADFEQFGKVRFQTGATASGQTEKYALLTEDQAYLLLTYSRNTAKVRDLKIKLVKSFGDARRAAMQHGAEYLPTYYRLAKEVPQRQRQHAHQNQHRRLDLHGLRCQGRRCAGL
ncbi:MAG: Rha family transcriptional regulator [Rhodoferax sp.]|nr:Rha family transcriptional regulator [Rhodoferax sp.]